MTNFISSLAGFVAGFALVISTIVASAPIAEAQIGPARRVQGHPVATSAVRARWVFAQGNNRIIVVNQANEVFYHRLTAERGGASVRQVGAAIRMRGHAVGMQGIPIRYVLAHNNDLLVVTERGELYRQQIRGESVGAPQMVPGSPIGTGEQTPLYMTVLNNQLLNVTDRGEIWSHDLRRSVGPARRWGVADYRWRGAGTVGAEGTPGAFRGGPQGQARGANRARPRHMFSLGNRLFVVGQQGQVWAHPIWAGRGGARVGRAEAIQMAGGSQLHTDEARWVFPYGRLLVVINSRGETNVHDIQPLLAPRRAPEGGEAGGEAAED